MSGSSGNVSVCSEDGTIKLSAGDSSKDKKSSRQILTFTSYSDFYFQFKDVLVVFWDRYTNVIDIYTIGHIDIYTIGERITHYFVSCFILH